MDQQFSLRWNNYLNQITDAFGSLRNDEDLVDVTLSCEGRKIKAHKMLLSACSSYFRDIFKENPCQHPVIVFRNVKYEDVQAIIDFMYQGEVNILQDQLESFLSTAEMMEVKGLTNDGSGRDDANKEKQYKAHEEILENEDSVPCTPTTQRPDSPPAKKRKQSVTLPQHNKPQPVRAKAPPVKEVSTPYMPVMVKEEVIEDLTIEDDEDEPAIIDRLKSEHEFDAGSPEDSMNNSMAPIDQMLAIEPGPSLEGVGQDMTDQSTLNSTSVIKPLRKECGPKYRPIEQTKSDVNPSMTYFKSKKSLSSKKVSFSQLSSSEHDSNPENINKHHAGSLFNVREFASDSDLCQEKGGISLPRETTVHCSANLDELEHDSDDENWRSSECGVPPDHDRQQSDISDRLDPDSFTEAPDLGQCTPEVAAKSELEESKFDYFGCATCKADRKPVDMLKITLPHKCPICPCACFCAHLLKEHMKVIHGWFNIQRKFKTY